MSKASAKEGGSPERRLFMVELKVDMPDTPTYTFFGSKKAIFEYFGDALRLSYFTSLGINFAEKPYENAVCRIVEGALYSLTSQSVLARRAREGRTVIVAKKSESAKKMFKGASVNTTND